MSTENPLDIIRGMNKRNEEERIASDEGQKGILSKEIEVFKQRLGEIKGTREEMISQYHEVINEAKKDPKTLQYVRDNFQELFKDGKDKWQELSNELNTVNESEKNNTEIIKNIDTRTELLNANKRIIELEKELEIEKKKQSPWWERYSEVLDFSDKKETYIHVKEYIKNNKEIAQILKGLKDKDYKRTEFELVNLANEKVKDGQDIREEVKMLWDVVGYYANLENLIDELKKNGQLDEAKILESELK